MKMSNQEIYNYAQKLTRFTLGDTKIPIRINFFLQRNINTIVLLGQEIENLKLTIASTYGTPTDEGFFIPLENREVVAKELEALWSIEQEVDIAIFNLSDLDELNLTWDQLSSIFFMIQTDEEVAPDDLST